MGLYQVTLRKVRLNQCEVRFNQIWEISENSEKFKEADKISNDVQSNFA